MKVYLIFFSLLFASFLGSKAEVSGEFFTDYSPEYIVHDKGLSLDKIEYRELETVFFFRFIDNAGIGGFFCGAKSPSGWQLLYDNKQKNTIKVANLCVNNEVKMQELDANSEIKLNGKRGDVYTCELFFPAVPAGTQFVNLLQGTGGTHFNFFSIKVKLSHDDKKEETKITSPAQTIVPASPKPETYRIVESVDEDTDDRNSVYNQSNNVVRFTPYGSKGKIRRLPNIQKKSNEAFRKNKPVKYKGTFGRSFGG